MKKGGWMARIRKAQAEPVSPAVQPEQPSCAYCHSTDGPFEPSSGGDLACVNIKDCRPRRGRRQV